MKFIQISVIALAVVADCRVANSEEEMVKPYYVHRIDHKEVENELGIVSKDAKPQPVVSISPTTVQTPGRERSNVVIGSSLIAILALVVVAFVSVRVRRGSKSI